MLVVGLAILIDPLVMPNPIEIEPVVILFPKVMVDDVPAFIEIVPTY